LLTNAPRPADRVERFLARIGAPRDSYDAVMSSGSACQRAVAHGAYGRRFHYIGPPNDLRMLTELSRFIHEVGFVSGFRAGSPGVAGCG